MVGGSTVVLKLEAPAVNRLESWAYNVDSKSPSTRSGGVDEVRVDFCGGLEFYLWRSSAKRSSAVGLDRCYSNGG